MPLDIFNCPVIEAYFPEKSCSSDTIQNVFFPIGLHKTVQKSYCEKRIHEIQTNLKKIILFAFQQCTTLHLKFVSCAIYEAIIMSLNSKSSRYR